MDAHPASIAHAHILTSLCFLADADDHAYSARGQATLSVRQFDDLNQIARANWATWLQNAPETYKAGVLKDSSPVGIRLAYGQNRLVWGNADDEQGALHWDDDINYRYVHRAAVALAAEYM